MSGCRSSRSDVRQYLAADALFEAVGDRDPMPFWKSAPYLVHFMRGYKFNERLDEARKLSPSKVAAVLRAHQPSPSCRPRPCTSGPSSIPRTPEDAGDGERSTRPGCLAFAVGPANSALLAPRRTLSATRPGVTKTLLFSAWNVVPDVVSAVLSYEAERPNDGRQDPHLHGPGKAAGPLATPDPVRGPRTVSPPSVCSFILPCLPLADRTHPLNAPPGQDRRIWVRDAVETMLSAPGLPDPQDGPADDRWEWAAPLLLDPELRTFLEAWRDGDIPGDRRRRVPASTESGIIHRLY